MAAQHVEQDLDRRSDRGAAIPERPQTLPLGSARWIDEDEGGPRSSRMAFTRTAPRRRRSDDEAGRARSPERRRSARS